MRDHELAALVAAWEHLPELTRDAIRAIFRSARTRSVPDVPFRPSPGNAP